MQKNSNLDALIEPGIYQGESTADQAGYYLRETKKRVFSKYAVALSAVSRLRAGDALVIDAGSSLSPIASIMRYLAENHPALTGFTVMTHNSEAFATLSGPGQRAKMIILSTGGRYDEGLKALFGPITQSAYERFFPRWVFIGHNGLSVEAGLHCIGHSEELTLKQSIAVKLTTNRVIITDFTKIGTYGGYRFAQINDLQENTTRCLILTDDPRQPQFNHYKVRIPGLIENFNEQIKQISAKRGKMAGKIVVDCVLFSVHRLETDQIDLWRGGLALTDPELDLQNEGESGVLGRALRYRIDLELEQRSGRDGGDPKWSRAAVAVEFRAGAQKENQVSVLGVLLQEELMAAPVRSRSTGEGVSSQEN